MKQSELVADGVRRAAWGEPACGVGLGLVTEALLVAISLHALGALMLANLSLTLFLK